MEQLTPFLKYMSLGDIKRLIHRFNDEINRNKTKTVAVLSLQPGEGRTFLVSVLALGSAFFMRKRVLVIDTHGQPDQGKLYLESLFGGSGSKKSVDLLFPQQGDKAGTDVADFQLSELIDGYTSQYDLIIFDTAAIQSADSQSMDPIIVAKSAGCAVMAVSNLSLTSGNFKTTQNELKQWGITVIGTVFNFGKAI